MGKWVHRLSAINQPSRMAVCAECGPVRIDLVAGIWRCHRGHKKSNGNLVTRARTARLANQRKLEEKRARKGSICTRCGFVAEHPCQLDEHHIDENHANDSPGNRIVLCANCHRLIHARG